MGEFYVPNPVLKKRKRGKGISGRESNDGIGLRKQVGARGGVDNDTSPSCPESKKRMMTYK